jgi:hypothetical protein
MDGQRIVCWRCVSDDVDRAQNFGDVSGHRSGCCSYLECQGPEVFSIFSQDNALTIVVLQPILNCSRLFLFLVCCRRDSFVFSFFSVFSVLSDFELAATRTHQLKTFPFDFSIFSIAKNEGADFVEWTEYHLPVGVDHFLSIENNSTDDLRTVLRLYIALRLVDFSHSPDLTPQWGVYKQFLLIVRNVIQWVAVINLDEFLVSLIGHSVSAILYDFENLAGVVVNWAYCESNGMKWKEEGFLKERFQPHSAWNSFANRYITTIASSCKVVTLEIHEYRDKWREKVVNSFGQVVSRSRFKRKPISEVFAYNSLRNEIR